MLCLTATSSGMSCLVWTLVCNTLWNKHYRNEAKICVKKFIP